MSDAGKTAVVTDGGRASRRLRRRPKSRFAGRGILPRVRRPARA
jgi:hypothetical protein